MPEPLTTQQVEHVARLARLHLPPAQVERFREQLSSILEHVAKIDAIDTTGVEPMAHPLSLSNRLAPDVVGPTMAIDDLMRNAPAAEGPYLAVPKVLGEQDDPGGDPGGESGGSGA